MRKLGLSGCIKNQHMPEDPNGSPRFPAHHPKKHALQSSPVPLLQKSHPVGPRRAADTYHQEAGLLQVGERHGSLPRRVRSDRPRGPLQTEAESQQQGTAALHEAQPRPRSAEVPRTCRPAGAPEPGPREPVAKRSTRPAPGLVPAARHSRLTYSSGPGRKGSKEALPESRLWLFKRSLKGVLQTNSSLKH